MGRYKKQHFPALKLLDSILIVYDQINSKQITSFEIYQHLRNNFPDQLLTIEMVESALHKLVNESYLISKPFETKDIFGNSFNSFTYNMTWEGRYFIESGGYQGRIFKEQSEKKRLEKLEESTKRTNKRMINLTCWIAVATVIAGIYYFIEIYKFFFKHD